MPQLGAMAFTREPRPAIEQMFDRAESCEIQRSTAVSSPQMGRFAWIVVLVLSLASPATARGAPAEPGAVFPIEQLVAERWTGDLDEMRRRRVIRVLVTYSKTFYFLDGAQQRGLTYEQLKGFEEFLNARLGTGPLRIHVVFIPVARDELLPGLVAGRGDLAVANLTITPERRQLVDFGEPLMTDVREIVVSGPAAPRLSHPEDLAGREVYVRRSSSYHDSLRAVNARLQQLGRRPIAIRLADENLEDEDILEMMHAGLVGITVVDEHKAQFWATVFPRLRLHRELAVRTGGDVAWALRKGSPKLRALINAYVAEAGEGSATGNVLLRRYLHDNAWVRNPATQQELRKFRATVGFFRKYADRYGFDYLMVAAQAYQESRLEQKLRSRSGAVGVMQIKPSTAAAPPIHIRNVYNLENNIHAGVKYLRFIVDEYFKDEPMDAVNKGLFAFASYNAGPARIVGLRRKAEAAGLDPNRWFGHVERVAAREIGRENVQYVANVYKYYVAYRMVAEQSKDKAQARRLGGSRSAQSMTTICAGC
jgi:membrane-bound lytic murein transglycosylase MltF